MTPGIIKKVFLVLMLFWMVIIFFMSHRDADTSTQDSERIGMMVGQVLIKDFDSLPQEKRHAFAESIDHKVRKTAHAVEYAVLGVLALGTFLGRRKCNLIAWLVATAYAVTDEIHQMFIPGRSGKLLDVINDSMGAAVGILVAMWIIRMIVKDRKMMELTDE